MNTEAGKIIGMLYNGLVVRRDTDERLAYYSSAFNPLYAADLRAIADYMEKEDNTEIQNTRYKVEYLGYGGAWTRSGDHPGEYSFSEATRRAKEATTVTRFTYRATKI